MERMKRAVSLLLCVFMVFGLLPMTAFAAESNTGTGNLPGGKVYTLATDGVTAGKDYLIVNTGSGNGYALTNNNGSAGRTAVTINSDGTIMVTDDNYIAWEFSSSSSGTVGNNGRYVYPNNGSLSLNTNGTDLTISDRGSGAYRIYYRSGSYYYYLSYNNGWTGSRTSRTNNIGSVYLYEYTETVAGNEVTFTVDPASSSAKPGDVVNLTSTITMYDGNDNPTNYDASKCTIAWISSNNDAATVSDGVVTAKADGSATITATLSAIDGTELVDPIEVSVTIKVVSRSVVSGVLSGNDPVTTKKGVEPDFSNIKLKVTYDNGDLAEITIDNGLEIKGYDINTIGSSYGTISYNGKEYGTVRVTVEGNPYEGLEDATNYPEYPADGAVRIDKTATELDFADTGLVQVELDVAGVSVKNAVDVILVTDLSNSMAWAAGGRTDASSHEATKMYDLAVSVNSFADTFLANEEDGSATRNTLSLVTFGGYDADHTNKVYTDYADPTQTLVLGTKDAATIKTTVNNIRVLADDALNLGTSTTGYYLSFDGGKTYGENYGNTNYDHAFMQNADAIAALKASYAANNDGASYDESGRQIYVIFMTDGAPSNYDGIYYNYKTGDRADVNCTWINAAGEEVTYTMGNNRAQYGQQAWFEYIAGSAYNSETGTITGNPLYWADQVYNTTGVADIISVGFDLDNGGFSSMVFTEAAGTPLSKVLEKLVTGKTLTVHSADDQAGMKEIYDKLATELRYAGTQANVSDVVDSDFTLQMANTTGTEGQGIVVVDITAKGYTPTITIKTYDLWTKAETDDATLIGTRKGTSQDIETVTFNADGTEAYSNLIDDGKTNILSTATDGTVTIAAYYFTYTNVDGVETFKWNIGNITDKEIALSYYAYLKGSLEGQEPNGLKYTNEEATLEYIDINGKYATQTFPIPAVAWGGASTAYEFYLVNEDGQPCNRQGDPVPFANRIIITGPFYQDLYLNQSDEEIAQEIIAVKVLPAGYTLYDSNAKYEVQTASGNNQGYLTISDPTGDKAQTTILVSAVTPSYIQSRVAFGVMYNMIPEDADFIMAPDQVVIDYGKSIEIDVNANNNNIPDTVNVELIGFSKFYDNVDVTQKFEDTPYSTPFEGTYGTFSIANNGKVLYTPHQFVNAPGKIFCVYKITTKGNTEDFYSMVTELDVIPTTIVYYETDFADGVFTIASFSSDKTEGPDADGPQNDGTIGQNTYGFDTTYDNDAYLSNGSSLFAQGAGVDTTTATFSFTGTGFDLISRTGEKQGLIKVQVYTDANMTNAVKTVSVLNKSESNLELYQIPVVSINGLEHSTYYVKVGVDVAYTNNTGIASLDSLNRGNEFYFDAIRIYDPAEGNAMAESAYNADGEANADLAEVREKLISANTFEAIASGSNTSGMVYVDSTYTDGNADNTTGNVNVTDYAKVGPNNEVYLSNGQAVAFKVNAASIPASFDIGAKSVASSAAGLKVDICNADGSIIWTVTKDIASSTVQFIDLLSVDAADASKIYNGGVYVIITNTGSGVLSITDLKTGFSVETAAVAQVDALSNPFEVAYTVDAPTLMVARMVMSAPAAPEVPEETEPEVPETTVPEETEPEVPETTVPEETEPEVDTSIYNILDVSLKIAESCVVVRVTVLDYLNRNLLSIAPLEAVLEVTDD